MTNRSAGALDRFGHCTTCGAHENELRRLERLLDAKQIDVLNRHTGCDHILIYRSVGLWTAAILPPAKPTLDPVSKLWIASSQS